VFPFIEPPRAQIRRVGRVVEIKWPSSVEGFALESAADFSGAWWPIDDEPIEDDGFKRVVLPITGSRQWFRLRR